MALASGVVIIQNRYIDVGIMIMIDLASSKERGFESLSHQLFFTILTSRGLTSRCSDEIETYHLSFALISDGRQSINDRTNAHVDTFTDILLTVLL